MFFQFCLFELCGMGRSRIEAATRALVFVFVVLARSYEVALRVNREFPAEEVLKAYKKVLLKVHPEKGG